MTDAFITNWNRQRCKGYIQTYVARPNQPLRLRTVAATIETVCRKHSILPTELSAIVGEVREESVNSFFGPPFYSGPEHQQRLDELVNELKQRGVL